MNTSDNSDGSLGGSGDEAEKRKYLWAQQYELTFGIRLSALYHGKRERFYALCERVCQAGAALLATTAFSQLMGSSEFGAWFALGAAIFSIAQLVFAYADRARDHAALVTEFKRLLSDIHKRPMRLGEEDIQTFRGRVAELEAGERATLGALVIHCENELKQADGQIERIYPLTKVEMLFMHFWAFNATDIVTREKI